MFGEHNTKAQAFYNRYGFEKFSQHHFMVGQKVDTDLVTEKEIEGKKMILLLN